MANNRLTSAIRDEIIEGIMKNAYVEEQQALDAEFLAFCEEVYFSGVMSEEQVALVKRLPSGFVPTHNAMKVYIYPKGQNGAREPVDLKFSRYLPMPAGSQYSRKEILNLPERLIEQHASLVKRQESLDSRRNELHHKVVQVVCSVSTISKLRAIWPEGERFIPAVEKTPVVSLPAVVVDGLNDLLAQALPKKAA